MRNKILSIYVPVIVVIGLVFGGYGKPASATPAKESIKIGAATALSGLHAAASGSELKAQQLWVEQVNSEGGLYVKEYGKKLPIEFKYYDNKSSVGETIKIYEKLITVDKVDLCLPPSTTGHCVAIIPTMEKHKFPWVACTSGGKAFVETKGLKYSWDLDFLSYDTAAAVVEVLTAHKDKIKTVAVLYEHEMFMVENDQTFMSLAKKAGFDIVLNKDYPAGVKDLSGVLLDIKAKNPDALVAFCYPGGSFLMLKQAMEIGLNPKFWYGGIGPGISAFPRIVGKPATEGICLQGTWSSKLGYPGAKGFYDSYLKKWEMPPDNLNSALGMQGCQILEQAIEKAGTLNREKLRDVIATEEFMTVDGPVKFAGERTNTLARHGMCQWQNGVIEVVWPSDVATAPLEIPKPSWP